MEQQRISNLFVRRPCWVFSVTLCLMSACNKETEQSELSQNQQRLKAKEVCEGLWAAEIGEAVGNSEPAPQVQLIPGGEVLGPKVLEPTTLIGENAKGNVKLQNLLDNVSKKHNKEIEEFLNASATKGVELFGMLCGKNGIEILADGTSGFQVVFDSFKSQPAGSSQAAASVAAAAEPGPSSCEDKSKKSSSITVPHKVGHIGAAHLVVADHSQGAAKVIHKLKASAEYVEIDEVAEASGSAPGSTPDSACKTKAGYLLLRSNGIPVGIVLNVPEQAKIGFDDPALNPTGGIVATGSKTNWEVFSSEMAHPDAFLKSSSQSAPQKGRVFRCLDLASDFKRNFPPLIMFSKVQQACAAASKGSSQPKN